jgi:anaerobic ribonucleoside-triphosphate reductase activating protein
MKLFSNQITFSEVPGLVSRCFAISNCGGNCPSCHSPELRENIGEEFTDEMLYNFIAHDYDNIDCYVFLGDGQDPKRMIELLKICKQRKFKTCLYVGKDATNWEYLRYLDYLKLGSYINALGGLDSKMTNQRMYKIENITNQFQNKNI